MRADSGPNRAREAGGERRAPQRVTARLGAFGSLGPSACVYLDAPTPALAEETARLILAVENGTHRFPRSAPACSVGDTAVHVQLRERRGDPDHLLLGVWARLRPEHLTHALVAWSPVRRLDAAAFRLLYERSRDFVFTVACAGRLDLGRVYLVKYRVEGGFRLRSG